MMVFKRYFDSVVLFLLFLFIIAEHHYKFTAIKNISLYLALFACLIMLLVDRAEIWQRMKNNFISAKQVLIPLILFVVYVFLLSFFYPYDFGSYSFYEAFGEFGRGIAFLFVILVYANGKKRQVDAFFISLIVAFIAVSLYFLFDVYQNYSNIDTQDISKSRIIHRGFAFFADRFLPFVLIGIIFFKKKYIKFSLIVFLVLSIFMLILAGARGGYLAVLGSIAIAFYFFIRNYKEILIKNYKQILAILGLLCCLIFYLANNSFIFQFKISQGTYSSGRDIILKERFPLLLQSQRAFWGLGHGEHLYDKFLSDEFDKGNQISFAKPGITNRVDKHWHNDEPFFIGNYFYYGFLGTLFLFLSFFYVLYLSLKNFNQTKNLLFLSIFISVFSYFGIHGLFEAYNLRILYLFYMVGFFILVKSCEENKI